jgi:hypothetical protein
MLSATFLVFVGILACFASQLAPYEITAMDLSHRLKEPVLFGGDVTHVLGTNQLGRDVASRLFHSIRTTLLVAIGATAISLVVGTVPCFRNYGPQVPQRMAERPHSSWTPLRSPSARRVSSAGQFISPKDTVGGLEITALSGCRWLVPTNRQTEVCYQNAILTRREGHHQRRSLHRIRYCRSNRTSILFSCRFCA